MEFKESVYPIINDKQVEKYQETCLSDKVKSLIFECIGDIKNDIQQEMQYILTECDVKKEIDIEAIFKQKYNIKVGNIYNMQNSDFMDVCNDIKSALITKKAIEELISDKKIISKQEFSIPKLQPSNADIEINIQYNCNTESGNKLVYIYDLYVSNIYEKANAIG